MVGFDVAMNSNIAKFLEAKFSISLEEASIGISIYFFSLMIGRFIGAILLRKIDAKKFLVVSTIIALAGLFGILFCQDLNITRVIIFIAGLGFSNLFPVMFAIIVEQKPEYANELSGLIIFAVSGGALIPPIILLSLMAEKTKFVPPASNVNTTGFFILFSNCVIRREGNIQYTKYQYINT